MSASDAALSGLMLKGGRPEFKQAEQTWRADLAPALEEMELQRKHTIRDATQKTTRNGAVLLFLAVLILFATRGAGMTLVIIGAIVISGMWSSMAWVPLLRTKAQTKQLIVGAAAEAFGFRYDTLHPDLSGITDWRSAGQWLKLGRGQSIGNLKLGASEDDPPTPAFDVLKSAKLLPTYDDRKFEDLIEGERAGARFSLVECKLTEQQGSGKNRRTVTKFQGLQFHIEYPERFLGRTLIARQGWWKGFFGDNSLDKVDMVSKELEDAFTIYSNDQVEARALLTPDRMERLIALERHFSGGKLRGLFEGDHLTLALEAKDQFEAGSIWKSLVDSGRYVTALEEMGSVCDVIDGFLTREWVRDKL